MYFIQYYYFLLQTYLNIGTIWCLYNNIGITKINKHTFGGSFNNLIGFFMSQLEIFDIEQLRIKML